MTEAMPHFVRADLIPVDVIAKCPVCGVAHQHALDDTDLDGFVVSMQDRFMQCDCGALLDIGWAGWRHHEGQR